MDNTSFTTLSKKRFDKNNRRKIGNNTYAYLVDEPSGIRWIKIAYHGNTIARLSDILVWVDDCGWNTVTTLLRINQILNDNNVPFYWNFKGCFRRMYPFSQSWDTKDYAVRNVSGYYEYRSAMFNKAGREWFDAN